MSEEMKEVTSEEVVEVVKEQVVEPAPVATQEDPQQQKTVSLSDLRVGYVVGLSEEGNFVFDIFGKQKGVVELLGLHQHATFKVDTLYNQTQMGGDALVHEIGRAMAMLNQKLDQIAQVVLPPKKPDNDL